MKPCDKPQLGTTLARGSRTDEMTLSFPMRVVSGQGMLTSQFTPCKFGQTFDHPAIRIATRRPTITSELCPDGHITQGPLLQYERWAAWIS